MQEFERLVRVPEGIQPGEHQNWALRQFPSTVSPSGLNHWCPGDPVADKCRRVLIGVATYWVADMRLLDALNEMARSGKIESDRIDVFEVGELTSRDDLELYFPGTRLVGDVPLAGIWQDGELVQTAWGSAARDMLAKHYPGLRSVRFYD